MKKFLFIPFVLLLSLFFISCEKEYSVDNGGIPDSGPVIGGALGGTAQYSLSGGTGVCTGATVNGTFTVGAAISASNTVTLKVIVDSVGTYSVTSNTVNGIKFTGSGTFIDEGIQEITLQASGTPLAAGTFSFPFGSTGCTFSVTVVDLSSTPAVFTLGGSPAACTGFALGGIYTAGSIASASNSVSFEVTVATPGTYSISSNTVNGFAFSGSGLFSVAGSQSVTLTATGTPAAAGSSDFSVTAGTSTCTFSVPVIAPAAFTLAGAPGSCTPATVAGTYENGTALSTANTITIDVDVTGIGGYSLSTNTVNGMTFSASGNFTTTGPQNIVLTGTGTPAASGTFTFTPQAVASGCTFDVVVAVAPLPSTDYLRVKIDGVLTTFNVNLDGDITALFLPNTVAVAGDNAAGPDVQHIDVTVQSATPITPGTYLQGFGVSFSTSRYYDPVSGQGWQAGTPSSPPLRVVITSISSTRVIGTFSGQYFDFNGTGTNSKQLTEGEFSVPLP